MIKLLCYRGGEEEESFRKHLKYRKECGEDFSIIRTDVEYFSKDDKSDFKYWPDNIDEMLSGLSPQTGLILYVHHNHWGFNVYDSLEAVGISDGTFDTNIIDDLDVFAYKYYEGFNFIFVAAHSKEEAIEILKDHLGKSIEEEYLDQIDGAKIEALPKIIKTVYL